MSDNFLLKNLKWVWTNTYIIENITAIIKNAIESQKRFILLWSILVTPL